MAELYPLGDPSLGTNVQVYDMDDLLGSNGPDLENFSLEFDVPAPAEDDVERLSDDLEYDEQEIERNTIHIPEDDLDDLDDLDSSSPMSERISGLSDDIFNDSDSDIMGNDLDDSDDRGDDLYDESRDSFDSVTLDSVMSDLNFEFGGLSYNEPSNAVEVENYFENPDDEYDEAVPSSEADPLALRRVSIDHTATLQQATGAMYKLIWEEGLLGLRLKMTPLFLPAVTKLTGKSSMLGIHLVEIGDYLVKIGDQETHRMNFRDVINLLKVAQKPASLTFRRASNSAAPPMEKDMNSKGKSYQWKSSIAQRIASRLEELQAEEKAKESQAPAIDMDNKYPVYWEEGPLGVSLVANKDVPYPQVTRITGKNRSAQVKDIIPGHYLISIGNYDTSTGSFNAAIKQLHEVVKPATLYFAPDLRQVSLRPEIGPDEYEQGWEKKQPLGFTLKCAPYGTIVADVGVAKTAKAKQKSPSSPTSGTMNVGDQIIWVNDECVEGLEFYDVLKALRQAKRPLQIRFRKEKAAIEHNHKEIPAKKPAATIATNKKEKEKQDGIPFTAKLSSALKDAVKMGKQHKAEDQPKRHEKHQRGFFGKQQQPAAAPLAPLNNTEKHPRSARSATVSSPVKAERTKRSSLHSPRHKSATTPEKQQQRHTENYSRPSQQQQQDQSHRGPTTPEKSTAPAPPTRQGSREAVKEQPESSPQSEPSPSKMTRSHSHESTRSHSSEHSPTKGVPFEYEITWAAGQELGVTLKPHPETRRAVVSRVTGNNENTKRMALGDILLGANGIPFTPQQKLNDTLAQLATMPKPVVLHFLRPARPVFPQSSRAPASSPPATALNHRQEYELEWPDKCRLGLLFSAHPMTNSPFVSRMEYQNMDEPVCPSHLKQVQLGDILIQLGSMDLRGLPFDQCIQALTVVSRPVNMRFRRGDLIPQAPVPKANAPHRKPSHKNHHHPPSPSS
ncbi:hypothetical protein THRCLA_09235 [Thraustotheca clavata]|uniref:PDZ domain-containing protein n=1 Tax=Thraustotheca clavata TaxID=74557 RepID=A0A1V9YY50_9STRA|nr:hypothetical protein THRCLA_09235 [Thraustotheca clavata]